MRRATRRTTDHGTLALHGLLMAAVVVAFITGLRIATETPGRAWINSLDIILPQNWVWTGHIEAAVVLIAVAIAYVVYIVKARLGRRIRFDRVRLRGLLGRSAARWGAVNVALYWSFFALMTAQILSGGMLYFGIAPATAIDVHWAVTWLMAGYVLLHVTAQGLLGGSAQLLRIVRPSKLAPPPPPFDPADILALLDEQKTPPLHSTAGPPSAHARATPARPADEGPVEVARRTQPHFPPEATARRHPLASRGSPHRRRPMVQAHPLAVAVAAAVTGLTCLLTLERQMVDHLQIPRVEAAEVPLVDGDTSDAIWRKAPITHVETAHGGNFNGAGETTISIQAVHDGVWAYFLFVWDDPTRSLKQLPLKKFADGWRVLHDGVEHGDEHAFNEDKFSVLMTKLDVILAGDRTFHAGPEPASRKPRTLSGRGLHYTPREGLFVDVWQWKATSTNASMYLDDDHFGPPAEGVTEEFAGRAPYRGGFAPDPGSANYRDNFESLPSKDDGRPIVPLRLPKNPSDVATALGRVDLDPEHGEGEESRWYMTEDESAPYSADLDRTIPEGTIIPGVILSGQYAGDRADVRGVARWAAGRWALEVVRRLDVDSPYDVPISTGTFMRVAAFDHAQIRHTRHLRPIRLEVER